MQSKVLTGVLAGLIIMGMACTLAIVVVMAARRESGSPVGKVAQRTPAPRESRPGVRSDVGAKAERPPAMPSSQRTAPGREQEEDAPVHKPVSNLFTAQAATCREVAERLQAKGMSIQWKTCSFRYPSIYVLRADDQSSVPLLDELRRVGMLGTRDVAMIVQYPTAEMAREDAGTMHDAFSWGRFLILGDPKILKEIRNCL